MPVSERVRMRATINMPGLRTGQIAVVPVDDPYIQLCIEKGYLVTAPLHGKMDGTRRPVNTEEVVADLDEIQHDPVPPNAEAQDADESAAEGIVPDGFEPKPDEDA